VLQPVYEPAELFIATDQLASLRFKAALFLLPSSHLRIMAHLTKPAKYDIKDSNIALLGSDVRLLTWKDMSPSKSQGVVRKESP
jgi:hypothetical protein